MIHRFVLGFLCALLHVSAGAAHPISVSFARFDIADGEATGSIEILVEDLVLFQGLEPESNECLSAPQIDAAAKKHGSFLRQYLTLRNQEGKLFPLEVVEVSLPVVPGTGIPMTDLMSYSVTYRVSASLGNTQPSFLTFRQNFGGESVGIPAMMELTLSLPGDLEPRSKVTMPKGAPYTISLTEDEEDEQQFGLHAYDRAYSFLYLERDEVRHEILFPLHSLETWITLSREDELYLEVPEQEAARHSLQEFFAEKNPVLVNQSKAPPVVQNISFFDLEVRDFARDPDPKRVSAESARIGIILSYKSEAPIQDVQVTWELFSGSMDRMTTTIISPKETHLHQFRRLQPTYKWTRESPILKDRFHLHPASPTRGRSFPVVSCLAAFGFLCVGLISAAKKHLGPTSVVLLVLILGTAIYAWPAPSLRLSSGDTNEILSRLLKHVYRAVGLASESEAYDALSLAVSKEIQEDLYLQLRQGLVLEEEGGPASRVQEVRVSRIHDGMTSTSTELNLGCTWEAEGEVEHWGHIHRRSNEYTATLILSCDDGAWRIKSIDVQEQLRFDHGARVRSAAR